MRWNPGLFHLTTMVALAALLSDATLSIVQAQPAPPPLPAAQNLPDPPARVGRVARVTGAVSFRNQADTQWSPVSLNFPLSGGTAFWTEPTATAELEISATRIAMAGGTEFDVASLDDSGLQGVAAQGEVYLRLRDVRPNEAWSVQTPRGLVHLGGQGRYDIIVGNTEQPTLVTVMDGSAWVDAPDVALRLSAGQTATITGTGAFQGIVGPEQRSAFAAERLNAEPPSPAIQAPAQVASMPGGDDLYQVGNWAETPDYGQVWYPPVSPGWVPYRQGRWAFVAPWGWTWIDDAPWGFAPFHYGRWVELGGRWAWTPGETTVAERPVYAPALVAFIGIGAGVALASRTVGWVPLGPREPYRPWFHASPRYIQQVNPQHTVNIGNVTINNFVNRRAATSVPATAMAASRPVGLIARPVSAGELAAARPIVGQPPLRPVATTAGVTPSVARQMNLATGLAIRPAPGPAVGPGGRGSGIAGSPGHQMAPHAAAGNPHQTPMVAAPAPLPNTASALPQVIRPQAVAPHVEGPTVITPHSRSAEPPHFAPAQALPQQPQPQAPHSAQPGPPTRQNLPQIVTPHPPESPSFRPMPQTVPTLQTVPTFRQEARPPQPHPQFAAPPHAEQAHAAPAPSRPAPPAQQKRPGER